MHHHQALPNALHAHECLHVQTLLPLIPSHVHLVTTVRQEPPYRTVNHALLGHTYLPLMEGSRTSVWHARLVDTAIRKDSLPLLVYVLRVTCVEVGLSSVLLMIQQILTTGHVLLVFTVNKALQTVLNVLLEQ